jgi:hypothetical protein
MEKRQRLVPIVGKQFDVEKPYVRNPKDAGGSKWISAQDEEDCAQEKLIQEWLKREGIASEFGLKHINSKGTARNTLVRAQVRLDQKIKDDGSNTFADLIAGCDGRDLVCRGGVDESEIEPEEQIYGYLSALGFKQEERSWLLKMWKLLIQENKLRLEKSATDLESWTQFEHFRI